jgi:hypothetical protein
MEEKVKDWQEDFEHENGNYNCICNYCKSQFIGHNGNIYENPELLK